MESLDFGPGFPVFPPFAYPLPSTPIHMRSYRYAVAPVTAIASIGHYQHFAAIVVKIT